LTGLVIHTIQHITYRNNAKTRLMINP